MSLTLTRRGRKHGELIDGNKLEPLLEARSTYYGATYYGATYFGATTTYFGATYYGATYYGSTNYGATCWEAEEF